MENFEKILKYVFPFIKTILILLIGYFAGVIIVKIIKKALNRSKLDSSFVEFLTKVIKISINVVVVLAALNSLGIPTTGILAALSAAVVGISVALKDSLSNVAGGILLLISPRFAAGDYIEADSDEGMVIDVGLLHTTVRTPDNRRISIPNGVLINTSITNYSAEELRRIDVTFPISYDADVSLAQKIAKETILAHSLTLREPEEPLVRVLGYSESSVDLVTRTWCKTSDYWKLRFDLTEQIRAEFEKNGIQIPFNQLDVNIKKIVSDKE